MTSRFNKLSEIADVIDSLHKTPKYSDIGRAMVRCTDVKYGALDLSKTFKVDETVFTEFSRRYRPKKKDIIITRVGSYGITAIVSDTDFCLGQNTSVIVPNGINPQYLYLALNSPFVRNQIEFSVVGSTQKTLSLKAINNLDIPRFTPDVEDRIAKIGGEIDQKIELNRQINQALEQIAQAIFKSWFVDFEPTRAKTIVEQKGGNALAQSLAAQAVICGAMTLQQLEQLENNDAELEQQLQAAIAQRLPEQGGLDVWQPEPLATVAALFPDVLVDSELGEVPEGWEVSNLKSVTTELRRGISPKYTEENGIQVVNQKCIRNHSINFELTRLNDPEKRKVEGRQLEVGDVLVNSTGVGTLGRLAPVRFLAEPTVFDSHVTVVRADINKITKNFLCGLMIEKETFIEASGAGSTGQTELRKQVLEEIIFAMPPVKLGHLFESIVEPMNKNFSVLEQQRESLSKTRDALLPKLLSGELTIDSTA